MTDEESGKPEEQAPEEAAPEKTPSAEAPAGPAKESKPEKAAPAAKETPAAEAAPKKAEEAKPGEAKPGEAKPGEAKPGEAKPGEKEGKGKSDVFKLLDPSAGESPKILKAKGSKNVHAGIVHVMATFNNTIVTVSDSNGNVLGWSSSGKMGFRGSRKSTAYAAQLVSQDACRQAMSHGLRQAEVRVKGPGAGRESAVRAVQAIGIDVILIKDVTPIPHNGCRPPKARRV